MIENLSRNGRLPGARNAKTLQAQLDTLVRRLDLISYIIRDESQDFDERLDQIALLAREAMGK